MRKAGLALSDFDFSGITSNPTAAAGGGAKMAQAFQSAKANAPRLDAVFGADISTRANERAAALGAEADYKALNTQLDAQTEAAKIQAKAVEDAYAEQGKGQMMGSAFGAIASIGGALLSDETTKHDINRLENALSTLRELRPVTFYYNEEYSSSPERLHHGFVAQEYSKVLPDATYFDESTQKLCIDTGDLIGLLVRAVQELETRVMHMEACQALAGVK